MGKEKKKRTEPPSASKPPPEIDPPGRFNAAGESPPGRVSGVKGSPGGMVGLRKELGLSAEPTVENDNTRSIRA